MRYLYTYLNMYVPLPIPPAFQRGLWETCGADHTKTPNTVSPIYQRNNCEEVVGRSTHGAPPFLTSPENPPRNFIYNWFGVKGLDSISFASFFLTLASHRLSVPSPRERMCAIYQTPLMPRAAVCAPTLRCCGGIAAHLSCSGLPLVCASELFHTPWKLSQREAAVPPASV